MTQTVGVGTRTDARIARKIMGWEVFRCGYFGTDEETPRMRELHEWMGRVGLEAVGDYYINVDEDFFVSADEFQPSRHVDDAWQVIEKMRAGAATTVLIESMPDGWAVRVGGFAHRKGDGRSPSLPLAICRAALAAVV